MLRRLSVRVLTLYGKLHKWMPSLRLLRWDSFTDSKMTPSHDILRLEPRIFSISGAALGRKGAGIYIPNKLDHDLH